MYDRHMDGSAAAQDERLEVALDLAPHEHYWLGMNSVTAISGHDRFREVLAGREMEVLGS